MQRNGGNASPNTLDPFPGPGDTRSLLSHAMPRGLVEPGYPHNPQRLLLRRLLRLRYPRPRGLLLRRLRWRRHQRTGGLQTLFLWGLTALTDGKPHTRSHNGRVHTSHTVALHKSGVWLDAHIDVHLTSSHTFPTGYTG